MLPFDLSDLAADGRLDGPARARAKETLCREHYTQSVPSGKSHYYLFRGAVVVYSIPANRHLGPFLLGRDAATWELARLWAADGHEPNLLTAAIAASVAWLRRDESAAELLDRRGDPNVSHTGGVYRAASWLYTGQSDEARYYLAPDGSSVARRKFHSGRKILRKAEIEALGYVESVRPGKYRFARGLTRRARRELAARWSPQEATPS